MKEYPKHIAIAGNIGSGKTTLAEKLAKHYRWAPLYESVAHNPYLKDFYSDMPRWAFHLQIYFLNSRFTQANKIRLGEQTIIQDRTIYEDAYIFADNLRSTSSCHPLYRNSYSKRLCNDKFADKVSLADTIDSRCDSPIE